MPSIVRLSVVYVDDSFRCNANNSGYAFPGLSKWGSSGGCSRKFSTLCIAAGMAWNGKSL